MISLKEIKIVELDLSDFNIYQLLSTGYSWQTRDITKRINSLSKKHDSLADILVDPQLLNIMGIELLNMPYVINENGDYSFRIPVFIDTVEADIVKMDTLGKIYKEIISKIGDYDYLEFNNKTRFILYNDKIEVSDDNNKEDVNTVHIITNVISVFLTQVYRRGNIK